MEPFKLRLSVLEEKMKLLETSLCASHETDREIHVSSIDKEQGVIPLNEFDTYRFVKAEDWLMPEFTRSNGTWKHGMVSKATLYFLVNPTQEIKELVELLLNQKINFTNHVIAFKYYGDDFESMITNKKFNDFYIFWYQGGPCYGKLSMLEPVYNILNSKPFEIETLPKQKLSKNPPYDFILSDFIQAMSYSANLTIDFKNPYNLLPHITFFLYPLDTKSIKVSLKSLSPQKAVFTLTYGKAYVSTSTQFHWMVHGSV